MLSTEFGEFQSTLLMRGATVRLATLFALNQFQSTLLMRGATSTVRLHPMAASRISIHTPHARSDDSRFKRREGRNLISIHAPHARSDAVNDLCGVTSQAISIHAPHARSDHGQLSLVIKIIIISIHAPHARSDLSTNRMRLDTRISIHAPHARSDAAFSTMLKPSLPNFNPRSSCEERLYFIYACYSSVIFQSTLLMRGATARKRLLSARPYFNPRSSCEERPKERGIFAADWEFQSTLLMRGATHQCGNQSRRAYNFNPRSSCEERRRTRCRGGSRHDYFNPRSSCEERRPRSARCGMYSAFQSTLLMRGATLFSCAKGGGAGISIHAPHARSDRLKETLEQLTEEFQSTLLMRGATSVEPLPYI